MCFLAESTSEHVSPNNYENALGYVTKNGVFLVGLTIVNSKKGLTARLPYFQDYERMTPCGDLHVRIGCSKVGIDGDICSVSSVEPVREPEKKKEALLVVITVSSAMQRKNILNFFKKYSKLKENYCKCMVKFKVSQTLWIFKRSFYSIFDMVRKTFILCSA